MVEAKEHILKKFCQADSVEENDPRASASTPCMRLTEISMMFTERGMSGDGRTTNLLN